MDLKVGSSGGGGGGGGGNHGGNRDGGRRGKGSQRGNQPQQSNDENDWNTVPMRQQRANNERIGTVCDTKFETYPKTCFY